MIYTEPLSPEDENKLYSERKIKIGTAFRAKNGNHYYLQRENDVLHIANQLINVLHVGSLNIDKNRTHKIITSEKFEEKMQEVIYFMDIDKYWAKK